MIQNLCMHGLPFAARQNEMIEMALTFKFTGMEVDLDEMGRRADAMGQDFATQFVNSANIEVSSFRLPTDLGADDEAYAASKEWLDKLCTIAEAIDAKRCYAVISPGSDRLAFQENFELQRTRITEISERLAKSNIKLGLALNAVPSERAKYEYQFVCKAEELIALVKSVDNVGLALDTWNWQLGDGAMDQISELGVDQIVDVRLADLPDNAEPGMNDRVAPGEGSKFAVDLVKYLNEGGYKESLSVVASFSDTNDRSRGVKTVDKIRKSLNAVLGAAGLSDLVPEEGTIGEEQGRSYHRGEKPAETKPEPKKEEKQDDSKEEAVATS